MAGVHMDTWNACAYEHKNRNFPTLLAANRQTASSLSPKQEEQKESSRLCLAEKNATFSSHIHWYTGVAVILEAGILMACM